MSPTTTHIFFVVIHMYIVLSTNLHPPTTLNQSNEKSHRKKNVSTHLKFILKSSDLPTGLPPSSPPKKKHLILLPTTHRLPDLTYNCLSTFVFFLVFFYSVPFLIYSFVFDHLLSFSVLFFFQEFTKHKLIMLDTWQNYYSTLKKSVYRR